MTIKNTVKLLVITPWTGVGNFTVNDEVVTIVRPCSAPGYYRIYGLSYYGAGSPRELAYNLYRAVEDVKKSRKPVSSDR